MGAKGNRRHLKRMNTPKFLQIKRKTYKFLIKPRAGPHPSNFCLPLGHLIRDLLKLATNEKEIRYLLNSKKFFIDGKVRSDPNFPIGLMDVVEIPEISKAYRVLPSNKFGLILSEITKEEAKFKLCRIENITTLKGGNVQLNLHDGRNFIIQVKDPKKKLDIPYKNKGTLKIALPDQKILDYIPFEESKQAIIYNGRNRGYFGKLLHIYKRFGHNASVAVIEKANGEQINTAYEYAFIIGKDKSVIDLPE